ncbi:hypothetical protein B0H34DRAFT_666397 [Crassisporium funariophilum]|nr:hypothetical protein B0H34DRAFT_666397 [Crassisporium funariophilum]
MEEHKAFFYGTLMHPKILKRVIYNDGSHLRLCPAVLLGHTRHEVKYADYPGVVPCTRGGRLLENSPLDQEEKSVRGTLVIGLTKHDISSLDIFEGSEYTREKVQVHPLGPFTSLSNTSIDLKELVPAHPPPLPSPSEMLNAIEAETYIYNDERDLKAELWSFDDFVTKNAWKWHGKEADNNEDITEVDRRRERG